jgi:hypothetical protein
MNQSTLAAPESRQATQYATITSPENVPAEYVDINGERFICIQHMEQIPTFFLTMVSASDHWLFAATNGALSAGRNSPETALFPYYTVDKIIDNWNSTGPQTYIQKGNDCWEPFKPYTKKIFEIEQRIYKSINGDTLIFEEINHTLKLSFRYSWQSSEAFGFVRSSKLTNIGSESQLLNVVDGIANIMAAGIDSRTQQEYSCLTDAYKLSELHPQQQLLVHRMAASLTDEAVPMESLLATTIWTHGWADSRILTRHEDAESYLQNTSTRSASTIRAARGAFFNAGQVILNPEQSKEWSQVAEIEQSQSDVSALKQSLDSPDALWDQVQQDIAKGKRLLNTLIAASDGQQCSAEEIVSTHHRANVLFNVMRGGVFPNGYSISSKALRQHVKRHQKQCSTDETNWLKQLPETISYPELAKQAEQHASAAIARICREYLPLTFSRRHGDPSRPWNKFSIQTKDKQGNTTIGFQGNWRDIFQNWEALAWSFPRYNEAFIRKFLNASTADGYNPYRITENGIEWEEPDPTDPWASIGYWGDHQIIYLLKLLEFSEQLDANSFKSKLTAKAYAFADVPYEIKPFSHLERDPNHSIHFNQARHTAILDRAEIEGADGKLTHDAKGSVLQVSLLEKLLIPLLTKLSNFVPGAGVWMNTQRPEWNDANNALAGFGLSMVTTCYLHRYLGFLERQLSDKDSHFECFGALATFITEISAALETPATQANQSETNRYTLIRSMGEAGERYRDRIYSNELGAQAPISATQLHILISAAKSHLKLAIDTNKRSDGLYHAYNILQIDPVASAASIKHLGPMLEGQVAILSSGAITAKESVNVLAALRNSPLYCKRRNSYILYTDKELPSFLDHNRVALKDAHAIPLLSEMLEAKDASIVTHSPDGCVRFSPSIKNRFELEEALIHLADESAAITAQVNTDRAAVLDLYEQTFNHSSFTGRSGSMFAYEGLGSIYWHMVSKLMLATQELALGEVSDAQTFESLTEYYYQIQNGLGFRKTPAEYGAFPADAYSHTPAHAGAQQPGLTGMVKEGVICRFMELGVHFEQQTIRFQPRILRHAEFIKELSSTEIIRIDGSTKKYQLAKDSLLFTLVQTPVIYTLTDADSISIDIKYSDGRQTSQRSSTLDAELANNIINRSGTVDHLVVHIPTHCLIN